MLLGLLAFIINASRIKILISRIKGKCVLILRLKEDFSVFRKNGSGDPQFAKPPMVKSMSLLLRGRFNAFCEGATIHGLGNIRRADTLGTKLSWGAVVLLQAGLLVYVFATYLDAYFNYYVEKGSTELSWEEQTTMPLPDVTICASSPFRRSAIDGERNVMS